MQKKPPDTKEAHEYKKSSRGQQKLTNKALLPTPGRSPCTDGPLLTGRPAEDLGDEHVRLAERKHLPH